MKCVSLFAGIGGFDLALTRLGHEIVWANEYDKYASTIYKKQFGEVDTRDITAIPTSDIPDHDLLIAGFPCQAFSVAGKRRGFEDTRGTLFFDIARILADKRPRYLLLENVKGLLSHDQGKTFQTILGVLTNLGYDLQWQVLNSKNFGVPQNRERVFIVGNIAGTSRPEVFPVRPDNPKDATSDQTERTPENEIAGTLTIHYTKNQHSSQYVAEDDQKKGSGKMKELTQNVSDAQRVYDPNGIAKTLKGLGGGMGAKTGLYAIPVLTPDRLEKRQNGRRFKENGEPAFTLTGQDKHGVYDGVKIRRLTPTECARLQGFPDNWHEGLSDTRAYKCYGNAVTVNVVSEIIKRMFPI